MSMKKKLEQELFSKAHKEIICERPTSLVFKNQKIYAKEVLTGVKIPILARCNTNETFGKLSTPYYGVAWCCYGYLIFWAHIYSFLDGSDLTKYALEHVGEDGTYDAYKKELEGLL